MLERAILAPIVIDLLLPYCLDDDIGLSSDCRQVLAELVIYDQSVSAVPSEEWWRHTLSLPFFYLDHG